MTILIKEIKRSPFGRKYIVYVDVECITGRNAYKRFNAHHKRYSHGVPTHKDYAAKFARWIGISTPYGLTGIIDCSQVSKTVFQDLVDFLHLSDTIVIMFGAHEDLWSIHVMYGKFIEGTSTKPPYSSEVRNKGILGGLRIFDIKVLFDIVSNSNSGNYNPAYWVEAGLRNLWKISEAMLCVNIESFRLKLEKSQWFNFWNVMYLSPNQMLHICLDTQMTVNCFMALYLLTLFPVQTKNFQHYKQTFFLTMC